MNVKGKNVVYIVDDDPDDRQIILDAFLENNALTDYVFFESAEELMEILHTASDPSDYPSLILLDLNMPGMLGLQALKEIKRNEKFYQIPTVVLTTSGLNMDRKLSYEYGANCFLTKPSFYSELVEVTKLIAMMWLQDQETDQNEDLIKSA